MTIEQIPTLLGYATLEVEEWVSGVSVEITDPTILGLIQKNKSEIGINKNITITPYEDDEQQQLGIVSKSVSEEGKVKKNKYDVTFSVYALATGSRGIDIILTHELTHVAHRDLDIFDDNIPQWLRDHYIENVAEPRARAQTLKKILR